MQDKSSYSSNNKPQISEGLQNFINAMVEEIVLNGKPFDEQKKKWLKKYSEAEGVNYMELERDLGDFFELIPEYLTTNTLAVKRITEEKAKSCYISDNAVKRIVDKKTIELKKEKEKLEREQALAEAKRKKQEEQTRLNRERKDNEEYLKRKNEEVCKVFEAQRKRLIEEARIDHERKAKEENQRRLNDEPKRKAEEDRLLKERNRNEEIINKGAEHKKIEIPYVNGIIIFIMLSILINLSDFSIPGYFGSLIPLGIGLYLLYLAKLKLHREGVQIKFANIYKFVRIVLLGYLILLSYIIFKLITMYF